MDMDIAKAGWLHRQSSVLHRWKRNWFLLRVNGDLLYFESPDHPKAEERIVVRARVQRVKPGFELKHVDPPEGMSKDCLFALDMRDEEMRLCAESSDDMRAWQIAIEEARVMGQRSNSVPPPYNTVVTHTNGYPGQVLQTAYPGQTVYTPGQTAYPGQTVYAPGQTVYTPGQTIYPGQTAYTHGQTAYGGRVVTNPPGTVIYNPDGTSTVVNNQGANVVYVDGYPRRRYDGTDMAMGVVAGAALGSMMYGPVFWW